MSEMAKLECQKDFSTMIRACGYDVRLDVDRTTTDRYVVTADIDVDGRLSRFIIRCDEDTAQELETHLKVAIKTFITDICTTFKQFTC